MPGKAGEIVPSGGRRVARSPSQKGQASTGTDARQELQAGRKGRRREQRGMKRRGVADENHVEAAARSAHRVANRSANEIAGRRRAARLNDVRGRLVNSRAKDAERTEIRGQFTLSAPDVQHAEPDPDLGGIEQPRQNFSRYSRALDESRSSRRSVRAKNPRVASLFPIGDLDFGPVRVGGAKDIAVVRSRQCGFRYAAARDFELESDRAGGLRFAPRTDGAWSTKACSRSISRSSRSTYCCISSRSRFGGTTNGGPPVA